MELLTNMKGRKMKNSGLSTLAKVLLIVGGLNWGLVGLFGFDLVAALFGELSLLSRIVYILVGLSAVQQLFTLGSGEAMERPTAKA